MQDHPTIALRGVLRDIVHRVATAASTLGCSGRSKRRRRTFVHRVLIGSAGKLRTLHLAAESTGGQHLKVNLLHIGSEQVLRGSSARHTAEHDAVEQRIAAESVV